SALGNPLAAGPAAAGLASLAATYQALRAEVHHAATQAATTLGTASPPSSQDGSQAAGSGGGGGGTGGAGAGGDWDDDTAPLDDRDIAWIRRQADGNVSWPDVDQATIGDCYLLATLQAYSDTEEGRQALRDQVRWEESQNAFVVTFHDGDQEVEITVRDYYTSGNQGAPSIINIYERAYADYLKDHTSNNTLAGGWPGDTMRDITGRDATHVDTRGGEGLLGWAVFWDDDSYTDQEWEQISEASAKGLPVVASTTSSEVARNALADTNRNGRLDPGDSRGDYPVVHDHVYTVVSVDDEYVTLYNPWAHNDATGGGESGGLIRMTREDYERCFPDTHIGEIP
ncbi:cysteine protease, partial [Actinomyces sp. 2119]|uniref:C2 family cysteine protease n=1 Tax=Actinomyces sp. 2119 TaxID=2321393 RepID=UPI000E6C8A12